jgi:hypothetical protein
MRCECLLCLLQRPPADLRSFMQCMFNWREKLDDAVTIATARFYNNLSHNHADGDSIAAFYAADAVSGDGGGVCVYERARCL